jgi:HKD family nuclease
LPPGIYEHLITQGIADRVAETPAELIGRRPLDPSDAHVVLARHLGKLALAALYSLRGDDAAGVQRQVELANTIAAAIVDLVPAAVPTDEVVADSRDLLLAIAAPTDGPGAPRFPQRPETDLSASALLVNGQGQPRIGYEVVKEFASSDSVDLLCAFITWHGLRLLESAIGALTERGGRMRVITTTYVGATERRALDRLVSLGAEVKISYETRTTRLHAKSWLFRRASGLSTAYVGSSNMSKAALVDGLEWNVRLSNVEQPHLLGTFADTYENYWADPAFETYLPERDGERLTQALAAERGAPTDLPLELTTLDPSATSRRSSKRSRPNGKCTTDGAT